ncbi:hypothetical protein GV832_16620 [Rhodobacteraceae bacterium CYK-10]|uniref:Uncharacterized protein n=2 Tax=Stagnihabitans tardus TaxID=2699202 RepID=A0AAE4YFY3_9RHOB|nr:hypothetical protein [Stagnihabitans tardus]
MAYPVDCAILLCLAGGFPASIECAHARAVMIARITPWPIEPPLQIWNCPMRIEYRRPMNRRGKATPVLQEVSLPLPRGSTPEGWGVPLPVQSTAISGAWSSSVEPATGFSVDKTGAALPDLIPVQDRADVDISDPSYDFVRSIRVTNIEYSQRRNHDGDCNSSTYVRLGLYGAQGDYIWKRGTSGDIPAVSGFAPRDFCGEYSFKSVVIQWRDSAGKSDFEEVTY